MTTYQAVVVMGVFAFMATAAAFTFAHKANGRKMRSFFPAIAYSLGILMIPVVATSGIVAVLWSTNPMLAIIVAGWGFYGALFVSVRVLDKLLVEQVTPEVHGS